MKKHSVIRSVILFILLFVLFFFIGVSLVTPLGNDVTVNRPDTDAVLSRTPSDASDTNDISISGSTCRSIGNDANLVFECRGKDIKTVCFYFGSKTEDRTVTLYIDSGNGFNENECYDAELSEEDTLFFERDAVSIEAIRIDFENSIVLKSIDFFDTVSTYIEPFVIDTLTLIIIIAAAFTLALIAVIIEAKQNILKRFIACIKRNWTRIRGFILGAVCIAAFAFIVTLLHSIIGSYDINPYLFAFIFISMLAAFGIWFFRKSVAVNPERLFLFLCIIIGVLMIIVTPIGHSSWDTDSHYKFALQTTSKETVLSVSDTAIIRCGSITVYSEGTDSLAENLERNNLMNQMAEYESTTLPFRWNAAHVCSGIALKFARFLGCSFSFSFALGKLPNLLIYAIVCYFAIKKLKSGKMIMSVIALFPTSIFLASNYSYDFWVTAFAFLGISYYYSNLQEPLKKISSKDMYIMCGAMFLACIPKAIYFTLLLLPFFMPKRKIDNRKKYYFICSAAILVLIAMIVLKAVTNVSSGGDLRGGTGVNPYEQIMYVLKNPITYAKNLAKFLLNYLSFGSMKNYISKLGFLGVGGGYYVFIILLAVTGVIDKNEYDAVSSRPLNKLIAVIFLVGTATLIASTLYVSFTPVGLDTINGCQERYLIPLIFPVAFMLGSSNHSRDMLVAQRSVANTIILSACTLGLLFDIYTKIMVNML